MNARGRRLTVLVVAGVLATASVALGVVRPSFGLLADSTTVNTVRFYENGILLWTNDPIRVTTRHVGLTAEGAVLDSGWHTHPGPEIFAVREGTLVVFQPKRWRTGVCERTEIGAGKAFIAEPGIPVRVTATGPVEFVATHLLPTGAAFQENVAAPC